MFKKGIKAKQKFTLFTLILALGVAVYLNWQYSRNTDGFTVSEDVLPVANATLDGEDAVATQESVLEALPDKNYGDAQLVSTNETDEYFEEARLTREKTRDEALDELQKSLDSANLTNDEKEELTSELSFVIANITAESDIENLIKAKGFEDCVVFANTDKVDVAVKTGGEALNAQSVAVIRDIVLSKVETTSQNITIVEVK